jgi:hypothetical protein
MELPCQVTIAIVPIVGPKPTVFVANVIANGCHLVGIVGKPTVSPSVTAVAIVPSIAMATRVFRGACAEWGNVTGFTSGVG